MIDTLELSIPFDDSLVETLADGRFAFVGVNLQEMDIMLGARTVYWDDEDEMRTGELYHPFESLPTNFTGMACKVYFDSFYYPHVKIKGSIAKIMQGHNVFGTDNLQYCVTEMLYWLDNAYPSLYGMLAVQCAEVTRIDITYMSKVQSEKIVRQIIDFLSRVNNGHTKATNDKKYETTAYWGGATSRLLRLKCYGKYEEFKSQLNDYKKKAEKGDSQALKIVKAMSDVRLLDLARNSLRWEATFLKRYLQRNNLPTNAFELINVQNKDSNLFKNLWFKGFGNIFQALKGQEMKLVNDDEVLNKIKNAFGVVQREKLKSPLSKWHYRYMRQIECYQMNRFNLLFLNKKIKFGYRKANNLYDFYRSLKLDGYDVVQSSGRYSRSRFFELIKDLTSVGFSKSYLQNLHADSNTEIIQIVDVINIDFEHQTPDWWVEPIPTPMRMAVNESYLDVA